MNFISKQKCKKFKSRQEYEHERDQMLRCAEWLNNFLDMAKPRRVVSGEAIKQGFTKSQLKAARKIIGVQLMPQSRDLSEDYWYIPWYCRSNE